MTGVMLQDQIPGVEWTQTAATISEDLTYDQWEEVFRRATVVNDASRWWLGDLLVYGERRYGHEYAQALSIARVSHDVLVDYRRVAAAIERPFRNGNLSFTHHRQVAALAPEVRAKLLTAADKEGLSVAQLRERVADLNLLEKVVREPRPKHEVLDAGPTVDAAAGLATVRESLAENFRHLRDPVAVSADQAGRTIGPALRALDEASQTLTAASKVVDAQNALDKAARHYREALTSIIAVTHWDVPDIDKIREHAQRGIRAADHELKEVST